MEYAICKVQQILPLVSRATLIWLIDWLICRVVECWVIQSQPAITYSKLTIETLEHISHLVSIANFEHVIAGWDVSNQTLTNFKNK